MSKWILIVYAVGTTQMFGQIYDSEQDCRRYLGVGLSGEKVVCMRQGSNETIEQEKKRKPPPVRLIIMAPEITSERREQRNRRRK